MKIAQIAPLYESIPPKFYGGTERVVSYLTEELVRQGHEVTLFASGDSITNAELISICDKSLRLSDCVDHLSYHFVQMQEVIEQAQRFDVLHFHTDYLHFPISKLLKYPCITTLHGRLDLPDLQFLYKKFSDIPLISISNHQRLPLPFVNWRNTVYHGIPKDFYSLNNNEGKYFAFLGRISPEKRVDTAIEIAKKAGIKIKIAAKIDKVDQLYFDEKIKHLFDDPLVEYIGEINEFEKRAFLANALALLFPIDWPEPFGLVMIEAMANGTPVIAFNRGAVQEVVDHGINGFIVRDVNEALKALNKLHLINRKKCREVFDIRFSSEIMAKNYVRNYEQIIEHNAPKLRYIPNPDRVWISGPPDELNGDLV
ncbi:glycosyltransferase family 4 protein [Solitalea koreensis]|uniref:Glycosyltransferase involved in cell wall bisynthesis n=1 Tax=Solitalea koreensis TaxID=543615 RepID=A0A521BJL8_9SPHI|nr:glycosyltransferase family 4 protein [Solitalea koreensis]SMO46860.1 Glycosyltransferase involved in cell wall bisynthesis [Solitalea koreensis]